MDFESSIGRTWYKKLVQVLPQYSWLLLSSCLLVGSKSCCFWFISDLFIIQLFIVLRLVAEDETGTQVLKKVFAKFVLFNPDYLRVAFLDTLILIVKENFEAKRIMLVLSECKSIICEQEAIVASAVTIE